MDFPKQEATDFFAELFYGEHHIPSPLKEFGPGWSVTTLNDFATYDFNALTRLVVLAHDKCIRASIVSGGIGKIKIVIHKRQREGEMQVSHPELEAHIAKIRALNEERK